MYVVAKVNATNGVSHYFDPATGLWSGTHGAWSRTERMPLPTARKCRRFFDSFRSSREVKRFSYKVEKVDR